MLESIETREAIEVTDSTDAALVRRRAGLLAGETGLDELRSGELALIATELASNVIKHAGKGGVLLGTITRGGQRGVALSVWDRARGMDLERCLVDGVSGAGSPGTGLGTVSRLASSWDGFSAPDRGTVITAAVHGERDAQRVDFCCGVVCLPFPGERACGDAWRAVATADSATLLVADGLGHGPLAAEAARAVCDAFCARADAAPAAILEHAHGMARSTRGAAASVARIDSSTRKVTFSGIGNVSGWLWSDAGLRPMLGHHGTLGHAFSRAREESYVLPEGGSVILATDGLKSRWELDRYPGLARCSAITTATLIWRDFARGRDDATVAVLSPARS